MKVQIAGLAFLAIAAGTVPAVAADWGSGRESYKDMSVPAAVPVPAPIPVAEYAPNWYFRIDLGVGVINDPDISGDIANLYTAPGGIDGPDSMAMPSSWFNSDFNTFFTAGAGVGYYFGNGWRLDATIEKRSKDDASVETPVNAPATWLVHDFNPAAPYDYGIVDTETPPDGIANFGARAYWNESTKLDGTIWMANLYYDFRTQSGFTPYIGAGLGFVWNEITRKIDGTIGFCNNQSGPPSDCATGTYSSSAFSYRDKGEKVSLAAAAMVGVSYDVSDMTAIDVGYRFLYMQGVDVTNDFTIGSETARSTLSIGDQYSHQIRAGLRFNVN